MRRLLLCAILPLVAWTLSATGIRDIDIRVTLLPDGSARVVEVWDIDADEGTEWYLVKSNLDAITIRDFSVQDESGAVFSNIGTWDVDRSLGQKARKCGVVTKRNGVELCWGLGSYGHHVYTASYTMDRAIENFDDFDALHLQLVSPGLTGRPEHVHALVEAQGQVLSEGNCRVWGFGYEGTTSMTEGHVEAVSTGRFRSNSALILLLRFDQGLFARNNPVDEPFETRLQQAMEGASFDDDDDEDEFVGLFMTILGVLSFGLPLAGAYWSDRRRKKKILGLKNIKTIDWCRDVPFGGNVLESNYVLAKIDTNRRSDTLAGALILRMIEQGYLSIRKDADEKVEICFSGRDLSGLGACELGLYQMMQEASGSDGILQDKEFSRWSRRHTSRVEKWTKTQETDAKAALQADGFMPAGDNFSPDGQQQARNVFGFRKFLKDFTLVDERFSQEVAVWNDYLVFGALYGIADKVARELKDIDPKIFEQTVYRDPMTARQVIFMTRQMSTAITNAHVRSGQSAGGFGGSASFGGGGGFHGGGFGGGAR